MLKVDYKRDGQTINRVKGVQQESQFRSRTINQQFVWHEPK